MVKKAKVIRKTLKEKLRDADMAGYARGAEDGRYLERSHFKPNTLHQNNINDFVRMIESWGNMSENAVIMIAGTDLRHHCNAAVPLRLVRVIGAELKRLGYSTTPAGPVIRDVLFPR